MSDQSMYFQAEFFALKEKRADGCVSACILREGLALKKSENRICFLFQIAGLR